MPVKTVVGDRNVFGLGWHDLDHVKVIRDFSVTEVPLLLPGWVPGWVGDGEVPTDGLAFEWTGEDDAAFSHPIKETISTAAKVFGFHLEIRASSTCRTCNRCSAFWSRVFRRAFFQDDVTDWRR